MTLLVYIPLHEVVNNLKLPHEGSPVIVKQANKQAQENFVTLFYFIEKIHFRNFFVNNICECKLPNKTLTLYHWGTYCSGVQDKQAEILSPLPEYCARIIPSVINSMVAQ